MRKVWISPYTLTEAESGISRSGFLIRLQTEDFQQGFADYFPWPQFGDWDVLQAENAIKENKWNQLLEKSFYLAAEDGKAREEKKSLIKQEIKFKNHQLITDAKFINKEWLKAKCEHGFSTFKIKIGKNFSEESQLLSTIFATDPHLMLRLDFNEQYTSQWLPFLKQYRERIEFIEDPSKNIEDWHQISNETLVDLAYDQSSLDAKDLPFKIIVIKPAKQNTAFIKTRDFVITSYLDHPVGIAHAYWQAQLLGIQKRNYGLMSWNIYEKTMFHFWIQDKGPRFTFKPGYGIGFDDLWDTLEWKKLI